MYSSPLTAHSMKEMFLLCLGADRFMHNRHPNHRRPAGGALQEHVGYVKSLEGKMIKVTFVQNPEGKFTDVKVDHVLPEDEQFKSFREKPDCLTITEVDRMFPVHRLQDVHLAGVSHLHQHQTLLDDNTPALCETSALTCAVCLNDMTPTHDVRVLSCNHVFHDECILTWILRNHGNCPLCKQNIRAEAAGAEQTAMLSL